MKPQWESYSKRFAEFIGTYSQFFEGVKDRKTLKAAEKVAKELNNLVSIHNEFGKLVEPIPPVEVKMPFSSEKFRQEWQYYKEYLEETHQKYLPSRVENRQLSYLHTITGGNEGKAMLFLDFFIRQQYKSIFIPDAKQLSGEEIDKNMETSTFNANAKAVDI